MERHMNIPLTASGGSLLRQIIFSEIPMIRAFGIISTTPSNGATVVTADKTALLDEQLCKQLDRGNYPSFQAKRICDKFINPFFIMNIDKKSMISLCKKYDQGSVIWATVESEQSITFNILDSIGNVHGIRKLAVPAHDENAVIITVDGQTFEIPLFDETSDTAIEILRCNVNPNQLSYSFDDIKKLNITEPLVYDINRIYKFNKCESGLEPSRATWVRRGITNDILHQLQNTFADLN
jgi:hypothetical protein